MWKRMDQMRKSIRVIESIGFIESLEITEVRRFVKSGEGDSIDSRNSIDLPRPWPLSLDTD
jgi:hypothetical protein